MLSKRYREEHGRYGYMEFLTTKKGPSALNSKKNLSAFTVLLGGLA